MHDGYSTQLQPAAQTHVTKTESALESPLPAYAKPYPVAPFPSSSSAGTYATTDANKSMFPLLQTQAKNTLGAQVFRVQSRFPQFLVGILGL